MLKTYKTRPYLFLGIGSRPWMRYQIEDNELRIINLFGGPITVSLPPASIEVRQSLVRKLFGLGDVVISDSGGRQYICEKVKNPSRFIEALKGKLDTQSGGLANKKPYNRQSLARKVAFITAGITAGVLGGLLILAIIIFPESSTHGYGKGISIAEGSNGFIEVQWGASLVTLEDRIGAVAGPLLSVGFIFGLIAYGITLGLAALIEPIMAEAAEQARLGKPCNPKEGELCDFVIYYPHIPKAVDQLLRARDPSRYHDFTYTSLVAEGSGVWRGQVIAQYGDFQITAPFDGRLEMVSKARAGLHEWPDIQKNYVVEGTEKEQKISNLNFYALVFPSDIPEREAYAFALRPIRNAVAIPEGHFGVRSAFDHGQVYLGMRRPEDLDRLNLVTIWKRWTKQWKQPYSFYSIIDMAVYNLKSPECGTPVPAILRNNQAYREELMRYWDLINHANAMKRCLS